MCETCGCTLTQANEQLLAENGKFAHTASGQEALEVLSRLLSENDHQAGHNREHFDHHGVLAINLMSSPGSGKTALLERTIQSLGTEFRLAVIEGDLETENDAKRIRALGVTALQITTGSACHLDAHMVHQALHHLELDEVDILFIENVGNLVCPASFDLGQHLNLILLSVTEGDDKPAKYPVMFRAADAVLISKTDLLPFLDDFQPDRAEIRIRELANSAPVLSVSAKTGSGMDAWLGWLRQEIAVHKEHLDSGRTLVPKIQSEGWKHHQHP